MHYFGQRPVTDSRVIFTHPTLCFLTHPYGWDASFVLSLPSTVAPQLEHIPDCCYLTHAVSD